MDVVFAKTEHGYLFRALSKKGKQMLDSGLLKDTDEVPEQREWTAGRYAIASAEEFMEMYDDDVWKELSDICLTCGICTFSCPTCVCFLITDEQYKGAGERVTVWDSCQFSTYSRMAGGHNARKKAANRVRNRTLDKFAYSKIRHGAISCTGCGRCVTVCPIGRSFPQAAARVTEKVKRRKSRRKKHSEAVKGT
jgi:formate hydrogenlyase subunit 6/NADH:ubiquinone oxidoreductase subunit I